MYINPYNFIPMGNGKSKADINKEKKLLSGVIEYSVLTKTPLFIPNTSCNNIYGGPKEHKSYQFYSYVDYSINENRENVKNPEPVIPGSEIRGMFRSNFEILTNSCMSALDSDMKLSKRTMESYQAGLLHRIKREDGTIYYDLHKATDVLWRTMGANSPIDDLDWKNDAAHNKRKCYIQDNLAEGERVDFIMRRTKDGREIKPLASSVHICKKGEKVKNNEGYIIKGERSPSGRSEKHCCHIFKFNETEPVKEDVKLSLLEDLLHIYADNKLENASYYKEYKKQYKEYTMGKGNDYFPVYYCEIKDSFDKRNKKIFLAPACKTREIYDNTLKNLAGELEPCTKKSDFCEACELFGTVTSDGEGKSSKIRFTDLRVEKAENKEAYYLKKPVTLPELSSPKLNNMEFYLKKPEDKSEKEVWFWTYDYYVGESGNLHIEQGRLAGRKFYWHQKLDNTYDSNEEKNERNITIKPAKAGLMFHGKLYFERISEETLDKLIYLLNAGETLQEIEKKEHGYKIGTAKPLGFGSIACHVDEVKVKSYKIEDGMIEKKELPYECDLLEVRKKFINTVGENLVQNFDKMTGFDSVHLGQDEHFSYPKVEENSRGYEWFTQNHKGINRKKGNEITNMPNVRKDMVFLEYMQAMEPRLKQNQFDRREDNRRENSRRENNRRENDRRGNNRRENASRTGNNKNSYFKGNKEKQEKNSYSVEIGIVQPYIKTNVIKFKIGQGKVESIQCAKLGITFEEAQIKYPEGSEIKVRFKGKSNSGFREYDVL